MRGNKKFLLLFALLLSSILAAYFISGCGDDSTFIEGDQPDPTVDAVIGTIHGTVTSLTNGALMEGVEVIWINDGVTLYDTTDANGYFSTPTDLPPGDYEFTFRIDGYAVVTDIDQIPTLQALQQQGDTRTGLIEVSETLDAALPQLSATVTGAIYTALPLAPEKGESPDLALDGPRMAAPVNGAVVQLDFDDNAIDMHPNKYWDTTGAEGGYTFAGLPLVDNVDFVLMPFTIGDTAYVGFAINDISLDGGNATFPNVYAVTTGNAHTTDNPVVLSYNFENDGFYVDTALTVTFSEPMNTGTIDVDLEINDGGWAAVDRTLSWGTGDQVLTVTPDLDLLTDSEYRLTLAGYSAVGALVLQDPVNAVDGWQRELTSQDGMRYVSSTLDLTDFPLANAIAITFDMDPVWPDVDNTDEFVKLLEDPYGDPANLVEVNVTASGATLTITPVSALSSNTNYRLTFKVYSDLRGDFVETDEMVVMMGLASGADLDFLTVNTGTLPAKVTGFVIDYGPNGMNDVDWVADYNTTSIKFKWNKVVNADEYEIYAKNGTTVPDFVLIEGPIAHQDHLTYQVGTVTFVQDDDFDLYKTDALTTPFTDSTSITYEVRAVNSVGNGPFSDVITIADQTVPVKPTVTQTVSADNTGVDDTIHVEITFGEVEYLDSYAFSFTEGGGDAAYVLTADDVTFTFDNDMRDGIAVAIVAADKAAVADTMWYTVTDNSGNDTTYFFRILPYIEFTAPVDNTSDFRAQEFPVTWTVNDVAGGTYFSGNLDFYISLDGGATWYDTTSPGPAFDAGTYTKTLDDTIFSPTAMLGFELAAGGFIFTTDEFVYGGLKWNIGATDSTAIEEGQEGGDSTYYDRNGTDSSFIPISFQSCGLDSILIVWSVDDWTNIAGYLAGPPIVDAVYDTVLIADPTVVCTTAYNHYPWGTGADVAVYRLAIVDLEGAFDDGTFDGWTAAEDAPREELGDGEGAYEFKLTHDYVELLTPDPAGDEAPGGQGDYEITWDKVGDATALVDIWYFETANDNEWANWDDSTLLVAGTANDGSWGDWAIPGTAPSATAKILMLDADGDSLYASENAFTVSGWTITTPADILVGTSTPITIGPVGDPGQADLYFSGNNFTDSTLVVANLATDAVEAVWSDVIQTTDAPVAPTLSAQFRIWGDLANGGDTVYATTEEFEYEGYVVTSPDSTGYGDLTGTDLMAGEGTEITWTAIGDVDHQAFDVGIDYSLDGGTGWTNIVGATDNDGSFLWPVPNHPTIPPTDECQVRVYKTATPTSAGTSDTVTVAGIIFTYPVVAGTSSWSDDAGCTLLWTLVYHNYTFGDLVIEYSSTGAPPWLAVPGAVDVDPDTTGEFVWPGDEDLDLAATYKVQIRESGKAIWYWSAVFEVVD